MSIPSGSSPVHLEKYSFGVGDRFARQAKAQLQACMLAEADGIRVVPVWNKSNREHMIISSQPGDVRKAVEAAVREMRWTGTYHVDADHINLATVDGFLDSSDYFTIDVAGAIGTQPPALEVERFLARHKELQSAVQLEGLDEPLPLSARATAQAAGKYFFAVQEAGRIYRRIEEAKGKGRFVTEISMDETDVPQSPAELLVILAALGGESIPVQTIAPKFSGRFNKGVDYAGDPSRFEREFRDDIAVIAHAVQNYHLPVNLKLSVHSGSDKFSIYPAIRRALQDTGAGVHVKTAGTTWLEELVGLAESGGEALSLAKEIYAQAFEHRQDLCGPYATVIDIDPAFLPTPEQVASWSGEQYCAALRHDPARREFNPNFRQLLHVAYKVAAGLKERYLRILDECRETVADNVTANLYERHLTRIFPSAEDPAA